MEPVSHSGRVSEVTPEEVVVEIVSESACAACHARSFCSAGDSAVKEVRVPASGWETFAPGDEVVVELQASMGHKAVWISYMIPLVLLVAALLGSGAAGLGELACGLLAIGTVALYYAALLLFRRRLQNEYKFIIRKK